MNYFGGEDWGFGGEDWGFGGEDWGFGGEASPLHPPVDETLMVLMIVTFIRSIQNAA